MGGKNIYGKCLFHKDFMYKTGDINLNYSKKWFTWVNNHQRGDVIKERLGWTTTSHY